MAYIRRKKIGVYHYYQLVESRRIEGKPVQRVLLHLGHHDSLQEALKMWEAEAAELRREARRIFEKSTKEETPEPTDPAVAEIVQMTSRAHRLDKKVRYIRSLMENGEAQEIDGRFARKKNDEAESQ